ncbi:hypothetical protein BCR42DRAFT_406690 [Absidia repens]|uniref:Uncharacterized protein n=1 Tax=Absidia repens TaxID=90262 RepID=A0A1X2IV29_9FUNG|nr:hypothetical protein BCR42DRAFT_406690 [Absidia repens]
MVDKGEQHSEQYSKELPSRPDNDKSLNSRKEQEQETLNDFHPLHPAAVPTRTQQQRHRRNLRLSGQVDVDKGSLPRHNFSEERRDSWIDRINCSTKNAIRRTSMMAAVDEKKLIDKVADSINDYGDLHQNDSWTDKVMSFLFPSMGLDSSSTNSDDTEPASTDQIQQQERTNDRNSWSAITKGTMNEVDKSATNKHPNANTGDKVYDDTLENKQNQEQQQLDLNDQTQWPPLNTVD